MPKKIKIRQLTEDEFELVKRAHSYFKSLIKSYCNLTLKAGLHYDDAVQEMTIIFATRLQGSNPFNEKKSGLYNYCNLLTKSVLINRLNKRHRHAVGNEQIALSQSGRVGSIDEDAFSDILTPESDLDFIISMIEKSE